MATNEVRAEKKRDSTDSAPAGEGTLGFDDTTLQGEVHTEKAHHLTCKGMFVFLP